MPPAFSETAWLRSPDGMVASSAHAGAASALEIRDAEKFTAVYLDGQELLLDRGTAHAVPKDK